MRINGTIAHAASHAAEIGNSPVPLEVVLAASAASA
jgi:hypothetical protein